MEKPGQVRGQLRNSATPQGHCGVAELTPPSTSNPEPAEALGGSSIGGKIPQALPVPDSVRSWWNIPLGVGSYSIIPPPGVDWTTPGRGCRVNCFNYRNSATPAPPAVVGFWYLACRARKCPGSGDPPKPPAFRRLPAPGTSRYRLQRPEKIQLGNSATQPPPHGGCCPVADLPS